MAFLKKEDGGFLLQEDGVSKIILDDLSGPSGQTSTVKCKANALGALTGGCFVAQVCYVNLTWVATTFGSNFAYYEVQRIDSAATGTIAKITDESKPYFADFEVMRGVSTSWQVRSVLVDGTLTAFVSFPAKTVAASGEADVVVVSNGDPDNALGFRDETPYTWTRSSTDEVTIVAIEGRDTPIGFLPAEAGGDIFTRSLLVAFRDPSVAAKTVTPGRSLFVPLQNLIENPAVPAVTVLDGWGWRWYTTPKIMGFERLEPGGQYKANVEFHETAPPDQPPLVFTDNPWLSP